MDDLLALKKGMKLAIEYGARLRLETPGVEMTLESRMVGMENEFLIITTPPNPQGMLDHKFFVGNEFVVRYLSHGTVYAFQTKLRAMITTPLPLLFLEYPKIVQRDELRSKKRANCMIPTVFIYKEEEKQGAIIDISITGCRCLIRDPGRGSRMIHLDTDKNVSLSCKFPGVKGQTPLSGAVRNMKKSAKEMDFGVLFNDETPRESIKLVSWYISTIENYLFSLG